MRSDDGKEVYPFDSAQGEERASTSETVNADLRCHRGLKQMPVRGIPKAKTISLWCALAYNVMHFAQKLLS